MKKIYTIAIISSLIISMFSLGYTVIENNKINDKITTIVSNTSVKTKVEKVEVKESPEQYIRITELEEKVAALESKLNELETTTNELETEKNSLSKANSELANRVAELEDFETTVKEAITRKKVCIRRNSFGADGDVICNLYDELKK